MKSLVIKPIVLKFLSIADGMLDLYLLHVLQFQNQ